MRILVVEDQPKIAGFIRSGLEEAGFAVTVSRTGEEGYELATTESFDAMILDIMLHLRDDFGISFLYITHDLSTAYQIGNDIHIMYQGRVAENGDTPRVIENPKHPYVQLLLNSIPVPDPEIKWDTNLNLPTEEEMRNSPKSGCRFYPRCGNRMDRCLQGVPPLIKIEDLHHAACFLYEAPEGAGK